MIDRDQHPCGPLLFAAMLAASSGSCSGDPDVVADVAEEVANPATCSPDGAACGDGEVCVVPCGAAQGACAPRCLAPNDCGPGLACRWVPTAFVSFTTACVAPELAACHAACDADPSAWQCPCGDCRLCVAGRFGPECANEPCPEPCAPGMHCALDEELATFYCHDDWLDVGKPCVDDDDCDASGDAAIRCVDLGADGGFCTLPCTDALRHPVLVCRDGFVRNPSSVCLPRHAAEGACAE